MHFLARSFLAAATMALALCAPAAMADSEYVSFSAGGFDVIENDDSSAHFGLEYRGTRFWHDLLPIAGMEANADGAVYGYVGLNYDWEFCNNWFLTPTVAVGAYEDGGSVDLGGVVEFRTGLEMDYRFENQHRLGVSVHHLSNAGIYDDNPGTETVMVHYAIPVTLFK